MKPPVVEMTFDTDELGDAIFRVSRRSRKAADAYFAYGQVYRMEEVDEAQRAFDRAYHANLRQLWMTLPESEDERFSSYENFRGWCLVKTNYHNTTYFPCGSPENAEKNAAFIGMLARRRGYSIVQVQGDVVVLVEPHSQRIKSADMDTETRKQSYRDVTDFAEQFVQAMHERQMQNRLEAPRRLLTHGEHETQSSDTDAKAGPL